MTINDQTANFDNFDNVAISSVHNPGYGTSVTFNSSGARTAVVIGRQISTSGGARAVGKSETLTFTGCGTATLTAYDGSSSNVELSKCY